MLTKTRWTIAGTVLGFGAALGAGAWPGSIGPADGQPGALGAAGHAIAQGIRDAATTASEGIGRTRTTIRNSGLAGQIEARLVQDKTLDASKIEIAVEDEGTAILTGMVVDEEAKETAVRLTRDTRGVARVHDHLAVIPPPRIIAAAPASAPTVAADQASGPEAQAQAPEAQAPAASNRPAAAGRGSEAWPPADDEIPLVPSVSRRIPNARRR